MALSLTLKSQERMILGGTVIRNTGRHAAHLVVESPVPVLRQRDILAQGEVKTPCGRLYLAVQLIYLEPDRREQLQNLYLSIARDVLVAAPSLSGILKEISLHLAAGATYRALQAAKRLMQQEKKLLERATVPVV
jgi:flagellar protein FlbT